MKINRIIILIVFLFVCSHINKNNVDLEDVVHNKYVAKIFYKMKDVGEFINNKEYIKIGDKVESIVEVIDNGITLDTLNNKVANSTSNLDSNEFISENTIQIPQLLNKGLLKLEKIIDILIN